MPQYKREKKVLKEKNTKVLGPLVTKQDFGGDLDLDEYNNSIDKPYMLMMMDMQCNSYTTSKKRNTSTMINASMLKSC